MGRGTDTSVDSILYGHLGPRGEELVVEPEIEMLPDIQLAKKAIAELSADEQYTQHVVQSVARKLRELEDPERAQPSTRQLLQKLVLLFLTPGQPGFLTVQTRKSNTRYCHQCGHEFGLNETFRWMASNLSGNGGHSCLSCLLDDDESIEACSSEHAARLWLNKRYG